MKKIGFVDFYISEWHANNYPAWIKEESKKSSLDYEVAYFWAEQDVSPVDNVTSDEWSKTMGITRLDTIEELCEKSDVIVILAPSNPEKHLEYAKKVLPYKKRTYIDKTFAPDTDTTKEIFAIADKYSTPFFSTSALRYAEELNEFSNVKNLIIAGGVSANSGIRNKFTEICNKEGINLTIPNIKYCTDNAAMIAAAGYFAYKKGITANIDLKATATTSLF